MASLESEETPLLFAQRDESSRQDHDAVYKRFSPAQKTLIVGLVSICGLIPLLVTGSFTPTIPQVAKDLHSTPSIINLAVSISAFGASVGGLVGGTYSTFYGRRIVYTSSLPLLVLGSIGVAAAHTIPSLLFWRFFQSVGASPGLVVGAGVIGDIYMLEERGRALGVFFAACLLGPSIAPIAGGSASYISSWRIMQGSLGIVGLITFAIMYFAFPETSQPGARGIDKLPPNDPKKTQYLAFINPLEPMWLLRSPNLLAICLITSSSLMCVFVLLVPLSSTVGVRYNIPNEALIGACFVPAGLGNILGAQLVGRISDRTIIEWKKKRGGQWYPEDRLRAALIPLALIVPVPLLLFAIINRYVDGTLGLILSLLCLFFNGLGVEMAFGPCAAYLVDVMHSRSAESLAANGGLRSVFMAASIAVVLPLINSIGIIPTHFLAAVIVWLAYGLLWYMIKYGNEMRAYVDVGFSTAETN